MVLELWQAWCRDSFPGEPVPVTNHPLSEESFSNVQSELHLTQLHSISLCPIIGHWREEISSSPSTSPHEEGADCSEVSLQSALLQAEQIKLPQSLLGSLALKAFHHFCHPPLDTL